MNCVPTRASPGFRWACLGLAAAIALVASIDTADARSKRKRAVKKAPVAAKYNPPNAAIVVDAKTGLALYQEAADSRRHPASLTKIMTLYLLFERLEAGGLRLNSPLTVSAQASVQPPTKLGLKPGQSIAVEDAIKALVTKSANDIAVVVAEALAGSEEEFARQMTRKARELGMNKTVYRNASGLPNSEQITTARDQSLLGIAIQERFPRYYRYFSTTKFTFRGRTMRSHNRLVGQVDGVDGIKTGYTRASGFNLMTSMHRGDRQVVAVVLGGRTGKQRDAKMRRLIGTHIARASTGGAVVRVADAPVPVPEPAPSARMRLASATGAPISLTPPPAVDATASIAPPRPGSKTPIKPVRVKTLSVTLVPPKPVPQARPAAARAEASPPVPQAAPQQVPTAAPAQPQPAQLGARPGILGTLPAALAAAQTSNAAATTRTKPSASRPSMRGGWAIQVGAFEDENDAKQRLDSAQRKAARLLGDADPYTERTTRGEKTYYRARFAGFDRDRALAACKHLKRNDIVCMALRI